MLNSVWCQQMHDRNSAAKTRSYAVNGENENQPTVSGESGILDSNFVTQNSLFPILLQRKRTFSSNYLHQPSSTQFTGMAIQRYIY